MSEKIGHLSKPQSAQKSYEVSAQKQPDEFSKTFEAIDD